jgi:uncharacterized integral membrane protein
MTEPDPNQNAPESETTRSAPKSNSGLSFGLLIFLILGLGFVVFIVQNQENISLRFLGWEGTFPLPILLAVTALLAVILDEIFGLVRRRRRRRRLAEREELARLRGR